MSTPQKSNSSNKGKWRPAAANEARRLGNTEGDWNLPGGGQLPRTRGASSSVCIPRPRDLFGDSVIDGDGSVGDCQSSAASSLTDSTSTKRKYWKPPATRVIVEVIPVKTLLDKYLTTACPRCESNLQVTFPTTCVASGCRLECGNKGGCTFADLVSPAGSAIPLAGDAGSEKIKRNTDSALNILYIFSFIASGDGGTEAARLLGLLGLPNCTTMQGRSFGNIEREVSPVIQAYTKDILLDNLKHEVALTFQNQVDEHGKKLFDRWMDNDLQESLWPRVDGCADMGWNQKGSGRRRNSKSGHALTIGMLSRKAIAMETCSKACGFCKTWFTRHTVDEEPPQHDCFINHEGTSGSMEPVAVLRMYKWLYSQRVIVKRFVADDDSSMKAKLKWSNEDYKLNTNTTVAPKIINSKGNLAPRPNHGGVPRYMPEPSFVADPNHRRKTLSNGLYGLADLGKTSPEEQREKYDAMVKKKLKEAKEKGKNPPTMKPFKLKPWNLTMTKMDCRRISKNFAFMARTLEGKSDNEMIAKGKAVIEHHFDNHEYCGAWCRRKKQLAERRAAEDEQQQQQADKEKKFYRDKTKDALLYAKLQSIIARFITLEALKEVGHNMDTCANESFNNTVSWLAPKNKVYAGTNSLKNRIGIALGVTTLGTMKYYEGLFDRMGIHMHTDVRHYLKMKCGNRTRRLEKTKTKEFKIKRRKEETDKIKKESSEAHVARAKREGVYQSGIGLDGGYLQSDVDAAATAEEEGNKKPAARKSGKRKATAEKGGVKPCLCGATDHQRTTSKNCPLNKKNEAKRAKTAAAEAQPTTEQSNEEIMAEEMDAYDSLALTEDADSQALSEDYFSAEDFYDDSSAFE